MLPSSGDFTMEHFLDNVAFATGSKVAVASPRLYTWSLPWEETVEETVAVFTMEPLENLFLFEKGEQP